MTGYEEADGGDDKVARVVALFIFRSKLLKTVGDKQHISSLVVLLFYPSEFLLFNIIGISLV
jgi:hypothetical protein